jgi:adenine specific DNA methylase Mod
MNNDRVRKKDSARLVWDSKPRRAPNPKDIEFQTAEVVIPNPHRDEAQIPMSFRDGLLGEKEVDKQKMNRLIWGDNLLAMQALLTQGYEGKINLIYIDPPFDSKADYSHRMTIEGNEFTKEPSVIERLAYKDTWTGGTDSYLDMLYPRLQLMKRLLAEDGSLYLHCDWHVSHYVKVMLDEIFGKENFLNNLVWCYQTREFSKKYWNRKHDDLLLYKKSDKWVFNWEDDDVLEQYSEETIKKYKLHDEKGYYRLCGRGISGSPIRSAKDVDPKWEQTNPELVVRNYLGKGYAPNDYLLIDIVNQAAKERTDFDTQKPEKLLIKLIKASSKKNEIVADFFCGSGTTLAIAEKLERHWIACELGKVGIQVTRARLVELQAKPFLIENIGNYQREMIYLTGGRIWEMQVLILKLYGATPRDKVSGLGIRKVDDTEE